MIQSKKLFQIPFEGHKMDDIKRLSIAVDHWIEHNQSHIKEYKKWAERAETMGLDSVVKEIENAIEKLTQCNHFLEKALKNL